MPEIPLFYCEKGSNVLKNPLEKGVIFNSQNYDEYPLLMAQTLPGYEMSQYSKLSDFQYARFQILAVYLDLELFWSAGIHTMHYNDYILFSEYQCERSLNYGTTRLIFRPYEYNNILDVNEYPGCKEVLVSTPSSTVLYKTKDVADSKLSNLITSIKCNNKLKY